jgi:AcrR family transcriptional regulator
MAYTTDRSVAEAISVTPSRTDASRRTTARERIVGTAYDLFCLYGIQAVGIDRIVAEARVAKTTLYHHFRSKDELVLAVLELRRDLWTRGWLMPAVERGGGSAEERLLAAFDALDEWFRQDDYEGCLFANSLLEARNPVSPVAAAASGGLAEVRAFLSMLAAEAGASDPQGLARQLQIMMLGAIVAAVEGNRAAAAEARPVAALLLERSLTKVK